MSKRLIKKKKVGKVFVFILFHVTRDEKMIVALISKLKRVYSFQLKYATAKKRAQKITERYVAAAKNDIEVVNMIDSPIVQ